MKKKLTFFLFAAEPSGDAHGSTLIEALKHQYSEAEFIGTGGPKMREEGLNGPIPMESFCVMGIGDVLKNLPKLYALFKTTKRHILEKNPDCVILIDYPGFNLRLMKALRKSGFSGKIVHYIAPSVWAHGKGRIKTLERFCNLLLVIYPFEPPYFSSMPCIYVGNPLAYGIEHAPFFEGRHHLGLFPGSRLSEIEHNLPIMLRVIESLQRQLPEEMENLEIALSLARKELLSKIESLIRESSLKIKIVSPEEAHRLMYTSKVALATSGTVTLELALRKTPSVVIYKVPKLFFYIGKYIARIKLPFYCIVNILLKREAFAEFFDKELDEKLIIESAKKALEKPKSFEKDFEELEELMGGNDPAKKAAQEIGLLLQVE